MESAQTTSLISIFSELKDLRIDRTKRHSLTDIITITICAVVRGADSWVDVELFGKSRKEWLSGFLELPNGIPSHDTFGRALSMLDAEAFHSCFVKWVKMVSEVTQGQIVAIDGKTVRRSHDSKAGKSAIHMVNAWASANRLVLDQVKVDDKSNEITAIPKLLAMLEVTGCIVAIDAMGCQTGIARAIVGRGADYVLALKDNQGQLCDDVTEMFEYGAQTEFAEIESDWFETVEKSHSRVESRRCRTISSAEFIAYVNEGERRTNLRSVAMVESEREIHGKAPSEIRYYISSLGGDAGGDSRTLGSGELCSLDIGRVNRKCRFLFVVNHRRSSLYVASSNSVPVRRENLRSNVYKGAAPARCAAMRIMKSEKSALPCR